MKRRLRKAFRVSAQDAQRALLMLIDEGKIAARDIIAAIQRREKLVREYRQWVAALGADGLDLVSRVARTRLPAMAAATKRAARSGRRRARRALSAATRAKYQAQGRYMAAVRPLSKALRQRVKAIRQQSGVAAAVRAAKLMARK